MTPSPSRSRRKGKNKSLATSSIEGKTRLSILVVSYASRSIFLPSLPTFSTAIKDPHKCSGVWQYYTTQIIHGVKVHVCQLEQMQSGLPQWLPINLLSSASERLHPIQDLVQGPFLVILSACTNSSPRWTPHSNQYNHTLSREVQSK